MRPGSMTKQALREFEEKMRTEGADGFAAGPRPWEAWDESGIQQLESPVWDSSALHGKSGKASRPGIGNRILNGLAMLALGSLAVGIAGVYFDDRSLEGESYSGVQPLPIVRSPADTAEPTRSYRELAQQSQPIGVELRVLEAPAAGSDTVVEEPALAADIETAEPLATPEQVAEPVVQDADTAVALESDTTEAEPAPEPVVVEEPVESSDAPIEAVELAVIPPAIEEPETIALIEAEPETDSTPEPVVPVEPEIEIPTSETVAESMPPKTGDWVINLSSYTRKSTANKMLDVFLGKGVEAEVFEVTINDKPMYRIRITGYESYKTARAEIGSLEAQLGLKSVWVSKK